MANQVVQNADDDSPASKTELLISKVVGSIPAALSTLFNDLLSAKPARKHFTEVLKKRELARMDSKRKAHYDTPAWA